MERSTCPANEPLDQKCRRVSHSLNGGASRTPNRRRQAVSPASWASVGRLQRLRPVRFPSRCGRTEDRDVPGLGVVPRPFAPLPLGPPGPKLGSPPGDFSGRRQALEVSFRHCSVVPSLGLPRVLNPELPLRIAASNRRCHNFDAASRWLVPSAVVGFLHSLLDRPRATGERQHRDRSRSTG
jgi:hypothetical protein